MSHMSKCYPYKWQHFKAVHMEQYSDIPNMPPYHHGVQHVVCIEECTKLSIYAMHKHLTNGFTTQMLLDNTLGARVQNVPNSSSVAQWDSATTHSPCTGRTTAANGCP